jgi:hypothetical protein
VNDGGNLVGGDGNMSWVICMQVLDLIGLG